MAQFKNSFELLAARYNVGFAQQITDQLENLQQRNIDLFDIMAINEAAHELRQEIKGLFALYRAAHGINKGDDQLMRRVCASHKTILMRRQISNLWKLYNMARADSRELTVEYTRRLSAASLYKSSLLPIEMEYRVAA
jgi:hypothetical protein